MERLAIIIDSLSSGGSETQTIDLANTLVELNYKIVLFSMDSVTTLKERISKSVEVIILNKRNYMDINCLRKIIARLRQFKPEAMLLVNTYSMMYGYLAHFFLPDKPKKFIVQHSTLLETFSDKVKNVFYRRMMNRMDRIVFVSQIQKEYWVSKYHIDLAKSLVIYNGIDVGNFENYRVDKATARGIFGFPQTDIIIGNFARLAPEKRQEDLVDGFHFLLKEGYPVRLLIVGEGSRRDFIEKYAHSKGIGDRVHIMGFVDDIRNYLACVDISVLSSSNEALSMSAIESMAMSKPLVLTDVGGARELVQSFENGIVYEPGNIAGLTQSLKYIIDNKLFDPMGEKSLFRAKTVFHKTIMINSYINLLVY